MGRDVLGDLFGTSQAAKDTHNKLLSNRSLRGKVQGDERILGGVGTVAAALLAAPVIAGAMGAGGAAAGGAAGASGATGAAAIPGAVAAPTATTAATGATQAATQGAAQQAVTQTAEKSMQDKLLEKGFDAFTKNMGKSNEPTEDQYITDLRNREQKQQQLQQAYANYGRMR